MYVDPAVWQRAEAAAERLWQQLQQSTPHPDEWCTGLGIGFGRDEQPVLEVRVLPQYASGIMQLALAHIPREFGGFPVVIVPREQAVAYKR